MASIRVTHIFIIESLSCGKTGTQLCDDISAIKAYHARSLAIELTKCTSAAEVLSRLEEIAKEVIPETSPFVHIEAHGGNAGIELADESVLTWEQLGPFFSNINEACGINLFLTVAACFGGYSATSIQLEKPAVFRAMFAPPTELSAKQLYDAFYAFYGAALEHLDIGQAVKALQQTSGGAGFYYTTAEHMFKTAFKYFFTGPWGEDALKERALRVSKKLTDKGAQVSPSQAVNWLKDLGPYHFKKCFDEYFAVQKYPANAERFHMTLSEVLGDVAAHG